MFKEEVELNIICKRESDLYNAYHMVQAFFPSKTLKSQVEEGASAYIQILEKGNPILTVMGEAPKKGREKDWKLQIERELYDKLSDFTGKKLAWGKLSGVRPTKLAMKKLEEGMERDAFLDWFYDSYRVGREKGELAWEIANQEKKILDSLDKEGYSLYVGIPFCPSICHYCSFGSGLWSVWKEKADLYVEALCKELEAIARIQKDKVLNTIYIGGGTPTSLEPRQLHRLLESIENNFPKTGLLEYTLEAGRPDSIFREKLEVIREFPIQRISINPQTMQQKTLDQIGRKHRVEEVVERFYLARELGFENINMDLILGLIGEGEKEVEDTLQQIAKLNPDSLTIHALSIKKKAQLNQQDFSESVEGFSKKMERVTEIARKKAEDMKLHPYYLYRQKNIAGNFENIGYSKVDKEGIYNILIMEEKQSIIAAGAGSMTKIVLPQKILHKGKETDLIRIENFRGIQDYINRVDEMIERKGDWLCR